MDGEVETNVWRTDLDPLDVELLNFFQASVTLTYPMSGSLQSPSQQEVLSALKRRLEQTTVPEFPRHRLRMLSKLADGAFGTV
ncbi:hypothetical protein J437_LFUL000885 [Ladona fulva]|uniref:Uncharacterized protein n=1 Tax=Ladona fulva TaxID=123851 RepID=A0A8K0K7S3_LADFU|nr:hypothetical protein J437_LFUL000885 [Ladona fulva]